MPIITLIPKEKEAPAPLKLGWFFWFSWLVFLVVVSTTAFVWVYKDSLNKTISKTEDQLKDIQTEEKFKQIDELTIFNNQLQNLKSLLDNHTNSSEMFEFIEQITHPKVYWASIDFQTEKSRLNLGGTAADLYVLANQLASLRENKQIKKTDLSGISINNDDNSINFNLNIELK